ncbi:hypothetical protein GCM10011508_11280 [Flavobacterium lutivivi]|nr:hypothetical protein GCM10011508_11280 [Flavobacterium lutivivi]
MSKLVYQPESDFFVNVNLINFEKCIDEETFTINIGAEKLARIKQYLTNSLDCNIICFPEFSYNDSLFQMYKEYSDLNGVIVIAGSGIETVGNNQFYAYCPVFLPNEETVKVYKKFITVDEKAYSKGRLIEYPNSTQRNFKIITEDLEYVFSIYICYDFLQCDYKVRTDMVFIPQLEGSPRHFINKGNEVVQGYDNFVFGVNNCCDNFRSLGFANLNSSIIKAFSKFKIRANSYSDANEDKLNEHHTIIYDISTEQALKFRLNLAKPVAKPYNFSYQNYEPNIIML